MPGCRPSSTTAAPGRRGLPFARASHRSSRHSASISRSGAGGLPTWGRPAADPRHAGSPSSASHRPSIERFAMAMRRRAAELGAQLRTEHGVQAAVAVVEEIADRWRKGDAGAKPC